jgi:molybdopterin-biosynthesis enzyme MoeA-like protein
MIFKVELPANSSTFDNVKVQIAQANSTTEAIAFCVAGAPDEMKAWWNAATATRIDGADGVIFGY